jgi:hypothetical protein
MGGLLFIYAQQNSIDLKGDDLFPGIALGGFLPQIIGVIFIIGLISALFPSADGALTALTSSFCIDILGLTKDAHKNEAERKKTRWFVHLCFAVLFFICVMAFKLINDKSIIDVILKVAGYTYGPLLGLFAFGILTTRTVRDNRVLIVCLLSPLLIFCVDFINNAEWFVNKLGLEAASADALKGLSTKIFGGFKMGIEILIINGLFTFIGLWLISTKKE